MDTIAQYEQIICAFLTRYSQIKKTLTPNVKSNVVFDKTNHHYQLISMGWFNNKYVYTIAFHISIENNKVWIHQNNTDVLIADELCEQGIPVSDIILGFVPEHARQSIGLSIP